MKILLAWPKEEKLDEFRQGLNKANVEIISLPTGKEALEFAKNNSDTALAIVAENLSDMSGLEFAQKLMAINAMIGCAVSSNLPPDDFHEKSEGLGIVMQLPLQPDAKSAEDLHTHLAKIGMISSNSLKQK